MNTAKRPRKRHILIIKGLRLSDLTKNDANVTIEESHKFYEEREYFWSEGEDLCGSDLKCWYCDAHFDGPAAFIPMISSRKSNESRDTVYRREGNYCSWPCASRDAYYRFGKQYGYSTVQQNLRDVYNSIHKTNVYFVTQAPEKNTISEYCGNNGRSRADFNNEIKKMIHAMIDSKN